LAGQVSWDEDPIARDEDPIASIQAAAHLSEGQLIALLLLFDPEGLRRSENYCPSVGVVSVGSRHGWDEHPAVRIHEKLKLRTCRGAAIVLCVVVCPRGAVVCVKPLPLCWEWSDCSFAGVVL
jgi:hypothetical protein